MENKADIFITLISTIGMTSYSLWMLIKWTNIIVIIGNLLMLVYWIAKVKRDVDKFHKGSVRSYIKYIISYVKKN